MREMTSQERRIADETIRLAHEVGGLEAQAYFNEVTATWPIYAVCELGRKIVEMRSNPPAQSI